MDIHRNELSIFFLEADHDPILDLELLEDLVGGLESHQVIRLGIPDREGLGLGINRRNAPDMLVRPGRLAGPGRRDRSHKKRQDQHCQNGLTLHTIHLLLEAYYAIPRFDLSIRSFPLGRIRPVISPLGILQYNFSTAYSIGIDPPLTLDLRLFTTTFGFSFRMNLFSLLGILLGIYIYKKA